MDFEYSSKQDAALASHGGVLMEDLINVEHCKVVDEEGNELDIKAVSKTDLLGIVGVIGTKPVVKVKAPFSHFQVSRVLDEQP